MLKAADKPVIKISTENVDLIYRVGDNGRLYQSYLGKRLNHATDIAHLPQGSEAYLTHGMEDYFEPAIHIVHNDGNTFIFYLAIYRKELLTAGLRSLVASWSMGLSAGLASAMLRGANVIPVHGVLLNTPKGGLLFCGQGGIGKSTTARRWREAGGEVLADDMVLLEYDGNEIAAHPLPTWSRCSESIDGEYFPFSKRLVLNRILALGRDPLRENIRPIPEWQYFMCLFGACTLFTSYMTRLLPAGEQARMLELVRGISERFAGQFPPAGMFAHLDADITQTLKDFL